MTDGHGWCSYPSARKGAGVVWWLTAADAPTPRRVRASDENGRHDPLAAFRRRGEVPPGCQRPAAGWTGRDGVRAQMIDLACVIHVHSRFSDGTATVPEIVESAKAGGADAVLLTDHDSLEAAHRGLEGWHGELLLLVGQEVTTRHGHLLVFGVEEEIEHEGRSEVQLCAEVEARRGVAFAAHPFSEGGVLPSIIRPHPWTALEECVNCGVELWSLVTDAAERWRTPLDALRFIRDPAAMVDGPPAEHLARWDQLCAQRRAPAIGGLDAHQTGFRLGGAVISPMPNERYFTLLRTHVLLSEAPTSALEPDRGAVYQALNAGRCYLALDALAPARGFDFSAHGPEGRMAPMGSELWFGPWRLCASSPTPAVLRLLRDGRIVAERHSRRLEHVVTEPGVYRAEARITARGRERLWIVTNPIYVR